MVQTIPQKFFQVARRYPDKGFLFCKEKDSWVKVTYNQTREQVESFAKALIGLGIKRGERVAILSENRPEWVIADLGTMLAGAILVPIHKTLSPRSIEYILRDSGSKVLLVSHSKDLKRIKLAKSGGLCGLRFFVCLGASRGNLGRNTFSWQDFLRKGRSFSHKILKKKLPR